MLRDNLYLYTDLCRNVVFVVENSVCRRLPSSSLLFCVVSPEHRSETTRKIMFLIVAGVFIPSNMIPEPELRTSGADLEKRNRHNNTPPSAPPLPPHNPEGLIVPRKPRNPCIESTDRRNLHRELQFNWKT